MPAWIKLGIEITTLMTVYSAMIQCLIVGGFYRVRLHQQYWTNLIILQAKALRVCSWALRLTPVSALQVKLWETPLELRRTKLALHYWVKVKANKQDLPTSLIGKHWESNRENQSRWGWNIRRNIEEESKRNEILTPLETIRGQCGETAHSFTLMALEIPLQGSSFSSVFVGVGNGEWMETSWPNIRLCSQVDRKEKTSIHSKIHWQYYRQ